MRFPWILVLAVAVGGAARGDDMADAKQKVARAEANLDRMKAMRQKGSASDYEVTAAELTANRARADLARLTHDEKEEQYREAVVAGSEAAYKRAEQLEKIGAMSVEEGDLYRRNLAAAKLDLAYLRGDKKAIRTQLHVVIGIEERRLNRVKKLFEKQAVTRGELDDRQKALDDAKERLKQAGVE